MHDHTCQHNMGKQRISIVPACAKSISHMSLLYGHSTCITREYGETMEAVHQKMIRTHQLLPSLIQKPATPTHLLTWLEAELNNLNSIYTSYQPLIQAATHLLQKEPSFDGIPVSSMCMERSLLPFLGDAFSWLTGTTTTMGHQLNQFKDQPVDLHSTESTRDPCLHHINTQCYQICNSNRQATYQHINGHDRKDTAGYNNTVPYYTFPIQQHQLPSDHITHRIHLGQPLGFSTLYERNHPSHHGLYWCSYYRNTLATHPTCSRSEKVLRYIDEALPSMMHLPISSEDTLHFYRYLCTHILIADEQFLLLIDMPIQDHTQQVEIYEVFRLDIPHGNYSLCFDIENKYLGITLDETSTIGILEDQFQTCKRTNRQFCILNAPLLPPANVPTCLSSLNTKDRNSI